jgi:hypothetical protein
MADWKEAYLVVLMADQLDISQAALKVLQLAAELAVKSA